MTRLLKKIRQIYGDMNLQSKFTIVLSIAVTIPVLIVGIFFYTRLYDMVVSDTIRKEQDASSEAAPLIEARIQKILDAYEEITELGFYETLFPASQFPFPDASGSPGCRSISEKSPGAY